jgi:hypothetical protein
MYHDSGGDNSNASTFALLAIVKAKSLNSISQCQIQCRIHITVTCKLHRHITDIVVAHWFVHILKRGKFTMFRTYDYNMLV